MIGRARYSFIVCYFFLFFYFPSDLLFRQAMYSSFHSIRNNIILMLKMVPKLRCSFNWPSLLTNCFNWASLPILVPHILLSIAFCNWVSYTCVDVFRLRAASTRVWIFCSKIISMVIFLNKIWWQVKANWKFSLKIEKWSQDEYSHPKLIEGYGGWISE